jgi:hypothetical protein
MWFDENALSELPRVRLLAARGELVLDVRLHEALERVQRDVRLADAARAHVRVQPDRGRAGEAPDLEHGPREVARAVHALDQEGELRGPEVVDVAGREEAGERRAIRRVLHEVVDEVRHDGSGGEVGFRR